MITAGRLVALFVGVACVSGASAQEPRPQQVFLSGENPYIALRHAPDAPAVARASFWGLHFSPVGTGHVCFVTVGEQGKPGAIRVALTDNARLADYSSRRCSRRSTRPTATGRSRRWRARRSDAAGMRAPRTRRCARRRTTTSS